MATKIACRMKPKLTSILLPKNITVQGDQPRAPPCFGKENHPPASLQVDPLRIKITSKKQLDLSSNESSNQYTILNRMAEVSICGKEALPPAALSDSSQSCTTAEADISPIIIRKTHRSDSELSSTQSSNNYTIIGRLHAVSLNEEESSQCSQSSATEEAPVSPLIVRRFVRAQPKSSSSQSSHQYADVNRNIAECSDEMNTPVAEVETSPVLLPSEESTIEPDFLQRTEIAEEPFVPVILTADDVEGAHLPNPDKIEANKVVELRRWLKCRNIQQTGTKKELIEKVKRCIENNEDGKIFPHIDKGTCYQAKKKQILEAQGKVPACEAAFFPHHGWELFPSRDIPNNFTFGSIFHYLIETMPQYVGEDCSEASDSGSSEEEVEEVVHIGDPFETYEGKEILGSKKLRRGLQYLKSDFVLEVQDCYPHRHHFYRARVRASMKKKFHWVHAALSQISGSVIKCSCLCAQRALGRCSHVSAVLLFILRHARLNGLSGKL